MKLASIVAQSSNRVIGRNNCLPWYLPEDLRYFKRITQGKPIVMGRKTFESIGKPLPGRTNIVLTQDKTYQQSGVKIVHSLQEALDLAEQQSIIDDSDEVLIIGGAEIYRLAMSKVERIYLTQVHANIDGDAFFPQFNADDWSEVFREDFVAKDPNPFDYSFIVLDRKDSLHA